MKEKQGSSFDGNENSIADNAVADEIKAEETYNNLNNVNNNTHAEIETAGDHDPSLPQPYEFLQFANPPLHTIFVPHFTFKSITFILTIIYIITFITQMIYNYVKPQSEITWNCSLF